MPEINQVRRASTRLAGHWRSNVSTANLFDGQKTTRPDPIMVVDTKDHDHCPIMIKAVRQPGRERPGLGAVRHSAACDSREAQKLEWALLCKTRRTFLQAAGKAVKIDG